jgi:ribonuclease T1
MLNRAFAGAPAIPSLGRALLALLLYLAVATAFAELSGIRVDELPTEAREMLARIRAGGPFNGARDGIPFNNRERLLPPRPRGYYHEYTVPTPGKSNRGARRIVTGSGVDEIFYTDDHYQSFRRVRVADDARRSGSDSAPASAKARRR